MKRLICYLATLFLALACMVDPDKPGMLSNEGAATDGKPVTITFSVPNVRIAPSTKSLENGDGNITDIPYLDPDKLFLVVCGGSQSIKYVRKAEIVMDDAGQPVVRIIRKNDAEFADIQYPVPEQETAPDSVVLYSFRAQLELSDSKRTIHFLGNIDENKLITGAYSYQILPFLLSYEGKQAYWQKLVTSITADDTGINPETGSYSPDEATINNFKYVPLIRNFAEIKVTNQAKQFKLKSYAVIFTPKQGSVVPYRHNMPFDDDRPDARFSFTEEASYRFSGYERCTIDSLESVDKFNYPGNLPTSVPFTQEEDIPPTSMFLDPSTSNGRVLAYDKDAQHGFFVYEREVPSDTRTPTFIILCGRFMEEGETEDDVIENETFYFYRLDLIDSKSSDVEHSADYFPIFRNFRYDIVLNRVSSVGVSDPVSAYRSTGAENISADVSMKHLSDISNGLSRLVVEPYMSHTFTGPNPDPDEDGWYILYVRFFDDVETAIPDTLNNVIKVELEPMEDQSENIITLYNDVGTSVHTSYPRSRVKDGEPGWRFIRFNLKKPSAQTKTQFIKITGRNPNIQEEYPLYREVEITLQRMQEMYIDLNTSIPAVKGTPQTIGISIPDSLHQSMFPLEFLIEAEDMTLTPVTGTQPGNNLPVITGKSLNEERSDKITFQFVRTLSWDEYCSLNPTEGREGNRTFYCYFKTTRSDSATTIWISNEFFNLKSKAFQIKTEPFYVQPVDEKCIVKLGSSSMEYRRYVLGDNNEWVPATTADGEWTAYDLGKEIVVEVGQRIAYQYAGAGNKPMWNGTGLFYCRKATTTNVSAKDGVFKVGGNIASLIVGDRYVEEGPDILGFSFSEFFRGHVNLKDAYDLELPMLTGQNSCYKGMFQGCVSLIRGPRILPATKMADKSYYQMFQGDISLTYAPVMVDAAQKSNCYSNMFNGCSSLDHIEFFGTKYSSGNFQEWVNGVKSSGTFVTAGKGAEIRKYNQGSSTIPYGWTVLP